MVNLSLNSAGLHKTCLHCQRRLETNQQDFGFCCHGCEAVHSFIKSNQFGKFYDIAQTNEREPASISSDNLVELFDDPDFRKDFAQIEQETLKVRLYVGGLSCYACIWLIEKAFRDLFPTVDIRTSLSTHLCQIEIPDRGPKLVKS